MKNNKILLLCQYFYPEKISSGILPYELCTKLAEKFENVTALVGIPKEYAEQGERVPNKEVVNSIRIKRLRYIQISRQKAISRLINMISFGIVVFLHPIMFWKCDTIICFTNPPILPFISSIYAKILKKRLITVIYDLYPDSPIKLGVMKEDNIVCKVFDGLNQFVYKNSYKLVAISEDMRNYLINSKNVSKDKIEVIHNWYNDAYSNLEYKVNLPLRIIYGGNMGTAQDMTTIINTIRSLKENENFEFVFAGHGNKKKEIERIVKTERIKNCVIYDFLPKEKYEKLLQTSHMAILSLEKEVCGIGSPSKYYGYLALKKPIIAIVPEGSEIAKDIETYKMGIHVNNGESLVLKEQLLDIYKNSDVLEQMSRNAYKLFLEKYTLNTAADKYSMMIEEKYS